MCRKKPRWFGPISLNVKKLYRLEVHNSKILNVAQMKVKVEYVQGHLYIDIFRIYRWCQAAIPIFNNLISFGRKTEPLWRNFPCFGFFRLSCPLDNNSKLCLNRTRMFTVSEVSWKFGWNRFCWFGETWLKKIINRSKYMPSEYSPANNQIYRIQIHWMNLYCIYIFFWRLVHHNDFQSLQSSIVSFVLCR